MQPEHVHDPALHPTPYDSRTGRLVLIREGSFSLDTSDPNQCRDVGHRNYRYSCRVTCRTDQLNDRGFLIDHDDIHNAVLKAAQAMSCEELCLRLVRAVKDALAFNGCPPPLALTFTLEPIVEPGQSPLVAHVEYQEGR